MQGLTNLEKLRLESVPDMGCIWKGLVLSKLTTLEVVKCKRLTHVFTCSMIASLVQLEVLKIFSCEELEQIIARDNDDENDQILLGDHLRSLCFPNLCEIEIRDCNKLKSLFPVAMASGLPNLQILRVIKASQFLGVFGQDDQASPVNVEKEMVLPNLKELSLEVEGPSMSKADHEIYYYTRWFNECSIRGAADLTSFLACLLVCLFLVSLNNKIYKLNEHAMLELVYRYLK